MRLACNPGRWLELRGNFELRNSRVDGSSVSAVDRESGKAVTLADLLGEFREDISSQDIGRVRIWIEAAR